MDFRRELWAFMGAHRKFWLLSMPIMLAVFRGLIAFLTQGRAVAPFIYTAF